jgi:hypothetical protein
MADVDPARSAQLQQVVSGIVSYTRWPANPPELRLCVVGRSEFSAAFASDTIPSTPPISVAPVDLASTDAIAACHIVYVGVLADSVYQQLVAMLLGKPVLLISEPPRTCSNGGMFCLLFRDTNTAFEVNLDSIARSGLRVNPNVLLLGRRNSSEVLP